LGYGYSFKPLCLPYILARLNPSTDDE
jgi:hypothetical protein